jgi:cobalt-zinc-cadmium efflux system outer membrane protein
MRLASVIVITAVLLCGDVAVAQSNRLVFRPSERHAGTAARLTAVVQPVQPEQPVQPIPPQPPEEVPQPPADPALGMSLEDLEAIALNNNPTLAAARANIAAARGKAWQAGLPPNPTAGYVSDEMGTSGTAGLQGAFVGQKFITGHKLMLNRAVVEREVMRAEQEWAAQRLRVLTDVRTHYYRALIAERRLRVAQELLGIGEKAERTADTLLRAQEARKIDVLQAKIEADRARIALQQTRNAHAAVWRALAAVVGRLDLPPQPLRGDSESGFPDLDWHATLGRLIANSPEMAAAAADVERAQWALRRAWAERKPNIDAQVKLQYDTEVDDTVAGVAVGMPIPLWNRNQGGISRQQAEITAAQNNVRRVELALQQRLARAFQNYADAKMAAEKYAKEILPNAQQTINLVTRGYEAGEVPFLDLLTVQRTYFQANLDYMDALERLWSGYQLIEGMLLDASLSR